MKTHFTLLLLFISALSFNQNQSKIDLEKLKTKVYQLVNEERSNNDRKVLGLDTYLKKAADDHAKYIAKAQTLSHEQTVAKKETPKERVYFYGGNSFVLVGENLLFTSIKDQIYSETDIDALKKNISEIEGSGKYLLSLINDTLDVNRLDSSHMT